MIGKKAINFVPNTQIHQMAAGQKVDKVILPLNLNGQPLVVKRLPMLKNGQTLGVLTKSVYADQLEARELSGLLIELGNRVDYYEKELKMTPFGSIRSEDVVAESFSMQQIMKEVKQVSHSNFTVLITGESGVGKEIVARSIHTASSRNGKPFVVINCAALPENLLESELFGYESGTFTGADRKGKLGKFEIADEGTVFLDEIGEISLTNQVKLLRVLQDHVFERVGGNKTIRVNIRL